jgi:predicted secreted protein
MRVLVIFVSRFVLFWIFYFATWRVEMIALLLSGVRGKENDGRVVSG